MVLGKDAAEISESVTSGGRIAEIKGFHLFKKLIT